MIGGSLVARVYYYKASAKVPFWKFHNPHFEITAYACRHCGFLHSFVDFEKLPPATT